MVASQKYIHWNEADCTHSALHLDKRHFKEAKAASCESRLRSSSARSTSAARLEGSRKIWSSQTASRRRPRSSTHNPRKTALKVSPACSASSTAQSTSWWLRKAKQGAGGELSDLGWKISGPEQTRLGSGEGAKVLHSRGLGGRSGTLERSACRLRGVRSSMPIIGWQSPSLRNPSSPGQWIIG